MDSQFPYTNAEQIIITEDDMAQVRNQTYDPEAFGPLSPYGFSFPQGLNAGPTPDDYLNQPNALNGLYTNAYGYQGIQQGPSTAFFMPQTGENQYFPGVQQHHDESYDYSGEEQDDQLPEYPITGFTTPEAGRAHQGAFPSTNLPASSERSPRGSSPPAIPTPAAPRALRFTNFVEAEAAATNRVRSTVEYDDWAAVKASPSQYVQVLLVAFSADYAATPGSTTLAKAADLERWLAYQAGQAAKTANYDDDKIEAACWVLLKNLIEAHEIGFKHLRYHKTDDNIKCSEHFVLIANAIRNYAVIRYDVVRLQRLDELVCCTTSAIHRKLANFKGNASKISRDAENQQNAQAHGLKYVPVLGDKKRKASANDDDDDAGAFAPRKASKRPRTLAPASESPADFLSYDTTNTDEAPPKETGRKKGKAVAYQSYDYTEDDDELYQ